MSGFIVPISVIGGLVFVYILSYVLKHFRNITLSLLMGFIIGLIPISSIAFFAISTIW